MIIVAAVALGALCGCATGIPRGDVRALKDSRGWEPHPAQDLVARNNAIRLALFRASQTGQGTVKARKSIGTIEGDRITCYLVVSRGMIEFVKDARKDRYWGDSPRIVRESVTHLALGYRTGWREFQPLVHEPEAGRELYLRFMRPGGEEDFF